MLYYSILATGIWSLTAFLIIQVVHIPPLFLEALIMLVGGLSLILLNILSGQAKYSKFEFLGFLGIPGNQICYLFAIKTIPIPIAEFLYALWPIFILLLMRLNRLSVKDCVAIIVAIVALTMIYQPSMLTNFHYISGCMLVIIGSLCWSFYVLRISKQNNASFMLGIYLISGSIFSYIASMIIEHNYQINFHECYYILLLGIGPSGLAYFLWDKSLTTESVVKVSWITMLVPIISYFILLKSGLVNFNPNIMLALGLITLSNFIIFA